MIIAKKYYPVVYPSAQYVMVEFQNGTRKTLKEATGYTWGEGAKNIGGGANLAYDILRDFANSAIANRNYVNFSVHVIELLTEKGWLITGQDIIDRYPEDFAEYELENILDAIGSVGK